MGGLSLGLLRWKQVPHRGCVLGRDLLRPPARATESPKELEPQHLPWSQRYTALISVIPFVERGDSNLDREPERFRPAESWMGWNQVEGGTQTLLAGSWCPEVDTGLGAGHTYSGCSCLRA